MNLFKISRGLEENLPTNIVDGSCWFCTDTSNFYIDYTDSDGNLVRSKLSSKYAEKLRYSVDGTTVEIDPNAIELNTNKVTTIDDTVTDIQYPSAKAAKDALDQKLNTDMGIAEAAVGDYISVNAIDENGVPTGYNAIKPPVRSISWLLENYPDVCAINVATKMQGIIFDLSGKYSKIPNGIYILDNNFNSITFYKYSIQNDRNELLGSISRNTITFISIIKNDDDSLYRIGTNRAIAYVSYDGETQIGDFKFIVTKEEALTKTNTTEYIPTKDYHPATKKYVDDSITTHNTADDAHNDIRTALSELTTRLNALADSDDDTLDQLSEIVAYIKSNKTLIDAITTSKVSVDDIVDNLTSTDVDKPLSANQGKILKELIESSVANLESTDNKVTSLSADSTNEQYPSAKAVYDAIDNADYIPVAGGEFNFQNPIKYNNVGENAWVFHSTSSKVTDPYGEEVTYDIGIAGNTVLACSYTDAIQDYRALYMRPEQVQVLDNSTSGDHRHGYLTPYRLVFQRYNNGYKNFNINAETDRTVICNDQKLIDFNQTRLENLGTPIEDNDAVNKKYVDDSVVTHNTATDAHSDIRTELDNKAPLVHTHDWLQNDSTAADYIANRPFYITQEETDIISENTFNINSSRGMNLDTTYTLPVAGNTYNVTYGDIVTTKVATDNGDNIQIGDTYSEFIFKFYKNRTNNPYLETGNTGEKVIKITGMGDAYKTIDERYLPKSFTDDKLDKKNPSGTGSFSLNRKADTVIGNYSFAEGCDTEASNHYSHAEGHNSIASGQRSHAEGFHTTASGTSSHAEGSNTTASGNCSHAEGNGTTASGLASHAEGIGYATRNYSHAEGDSRALSEYQHTQGKFNIEDDANIYAHIVGNGSQGSSAGERRCSNAHTLDWSGNAWFAGDVYIGSTSGINKDEGSKKLATEEYVTTAVSAINSVPACTTDDNDKILSVVDGVPTWVTITNAEGVAY